MNRALTAALVAGAFFLALPLTAAESDVVIVSHRALYDFNMISATSGAGVADIRGKMYYEQADVCDAWTTDHRFSVEYHYPDQQPVLSVSHYTAWESADGQKFSFSSDRQENGQQVEQLRGTVNRKDDGTASADYARPPDLAFALPQGYLLPTQHTIEALRRARKGEKLFSATIFDGTDADGPVIINTFFGKKATAEEIAKIAGKGKIDKALLTPDAWHVRMSVFPLKDKENMAPSYEMDVILHDNGIISHVLLDYGTFKVEQNLLALDGLAVRKCS